MFSPAHGSSRTSSPAAPQTHTPSLTRAPSGARGRSPHRRERWRCPPVPPPRGVIIYSLLRSTSHLDAAARTLADRCVDGITANPRAARVRSPELGRHRHSSLAGARLRHQCGDREGVARDRSAAADDHRRPGSDDRRTHRRAAHSRCFDRVGGAIAAPAGRRRRRPALNPVGPGWRVRARWCPGSGTGTPPRRAQWTLLLVAVGHAAVVEDGQHVCAMRGSIVRRSPRARCRRAFREPDR